LQNKRNNRTNPGPLKILEGAKNSSRGAKKARKIASTLKQTREKISVPLAGINIITPQTGFFVFERKFVLQENEYSCDENRSKISGSMKMRFPARKFTHTFCETFSRGAKKTGQITSLLKETREKISVPLRFIPKWIILRFFSLFCCVYFATGGSSNEPHLAHRVYDRRLENKENCKSKEKSQFPCHPQLQCGHVITSAPWAWYDTVRPALLTKKTLRPATLTTHPAAVRTSTNAQHTPGRSFAPHDAEEHQATRNTQGVQADPESYDPER
jgi:hypothetical protein